MAHGRFFLHGDVYKVALEHALDAVVGVNGRSKIEVWNSQATAIFGWTAQEALGACMTELIIPEAMRTGHVRGMHQYFASGHRGILNQRIKLSALNKAGIEFPIELTVIDVVSEENVTFFAFIRDLSEQERIESSRRAAVKERSDACAQAQKALAVRDIFLSIAAHELNTPLTSLKLQVQMFSRRHSRGGVINLPRLFGMFDEQVERLSALVNSMLDVTRAERGQMELASVRMNLGSMVKQVVSQFEHSLTLAKCQCEFHEDALIEGCWDASRLQQVVANLLANAIKYAPNSTIRVVIDVRQSDARVSIADNGPGIPLERQASIFECYERGTPRPGVSGLGLGLFISRQIARAHGGDLTVESDLGRGATFVMRLPMRQS